MSKKATLILGLILSLNSALMAQTNPGADSKAHFSAGLLMGYSSGFSIQGYGLVSNFAEGFPLRARLGLGYVATEPGDALAARRIFINDATNGIPEESGRTWALKLDVQYPVSLLSMERAFLFGGLRYARFTGNFKFVGGNEDFDVTSNHWGLGAGLESYFMVSPRFDMVLTAGLDYFFSSSLSGHDTSYSPEGEDQNPRNDYTYSDADAAIGQPKLDPVLMLGFAYNF